MVLRELKEISINKWKLKVILKKFSNLINKILSLLRLFLLGIGCTNLSVQGVLDEISDHE